jgi:transcriptional regulator with XRE-family HTH domain
MKMSEKDNNGSEIDVSPEGIGIRIFHARKNAGISGRELAEKLNRSPSYLSRIENGRVRPSLELLKDISNELGVPFLDLVTDEATDKKLERIWPELVNLIQDAKIINLMDPGLKRELIIVHQKVKEVKDSMASTEVLNK